MLFSKLVGGDDITRVLSSYYGLKQSKQSKYPNKWIDFLLKQFRGMMFYLDDSLDAYYDPTSPEHAFDESFRNSMHSMPRNSMNSSQRKNIVQPNVSGGKSKSDIVESRHSNDFKPNDPVSDLKLSSLPIQPDFNDRIDWDHDFIWDLVNINAIVDDEAKTGGNSKYSKHGAYFEQCKRIIDNSFILTIHVYYYSQ